MKFINGQLKIEIVAKRRGAYLPIVLMISVLGMALAYSLTSIAMSNLNRSRHDEKFVSALEIAEAGINYYMWHLSHSNTDYCDGLAVSDTKCQNAPYGPFDHNYTDQSGQILGTYSLYITPPIGGESTATVKSVGKIKGKSPERSIVATLGMPSFTKYTLLSDGIQLWVGQNEKISGSVFVNGSGMYNEGEVVGDAFSTEKTYASWQWGDQPGVAGPGVYGGSKLFPVTRIDMNQLSVDIVKLREEAHNYGDLYGTSNGSGYHLILGKDNYQICLVNNYESRDTRANHLAITSQNCLAPGMGTKPYPEDGIIMLEDDTWIEGKIDHQKITIVASDPDETRSSRQKHIIIPNNLLYTSYDGSDKIGLISQTGINLTRNAPSDMEIDAAMIAKNGEIKIGPYCSPSFTCASDQKDKIKVFGSMAHKGGLLWTTDYGSGKWSGYASTETLIDNNNILNPPPQFPTTGSYVVLNWREE